MITNIPMIYSQNLKNANERTFISILWILSGYNNSPAFFSKEYVSYIGSNRVFDSLIKTLTQRNIISYFVKGVGASKHRYFTIIDPAIVEELKQNTKPQTQTKQQTDTPQKTSLKDRFAEKQQQQTQNIELSFNAVFSQMKKINAQTADFNFTEPELREQAQNYVDKSQSYNFYRGEITDNKICSWLRSALKHNQQQSNAPQKQKTEIDYICEDTFENRMARLQKFKELQEKHKQENSDPIDADFNIIENEAQTPDTDHKTPSETDKKPVYQMSYANFKNDLNSFDKKKNAL
ncbi:MAG: hypothetical protein SPK94_01750 [Bacteroidales bacterium]|nr:hypothetical protein [Bacteroidales bacterium]